MDFLFLLASEGGGERTLWDPTLKGILVTIAAVVLFCGSVYLLLATDVGARLGFLLSLGAVSGFLVMLTLLWLVNQFPLSSYRGELASWKPLVVYDSAAGIPQGDEAALPDEATEVTDESKSEKMTSSQAGDLKAAIEAALVQPAEASGETPEFARYQAANEFLVVDGSQRIIEPEEPNPLKLQFFHDSIVASAQFCDAKTIPDTFPEPPPDPVCDPTQPRQTIIFERDLGSLKLRPFGAFLMSLILFVLTLWILHGRERDERELARIKERELEPAPAS